MKSRFSIIFYLFFILPAIVMGVEINRPKAKFLQDSVKLGEPVMLSFSYKHSPKEELIFPDSNYNFFPFEFISKKYYPTVTDTTGSLDSIVYTLSTYELLPKLGISLPVYIFEAGDTSTLYSNESYITLKEQLTVITPQDSLRVNTQFGELTAKFNYPFALIGLGILIIAALIIFLFFRKKLFAQFKLYRMRLDYTKFISKYADLNQAYAQNPSYILLEDILSLWKKYLEKLEKEPYTSLTTKEISRKFDTNQLTSSLQNFDKAIYGGFINEDMTNSIAFLRETAERQYTSKRENIRNGMA